tara:strand:+ start:44 stop:370 length:327 start_codon:yes stop_codon:yes gene_type:complete
MFDKLPSDLILHILDYTQKYKYNNCYLVSKRFNKLSTMKYERDMKELIKLNNNFKANNHIRYAAYLTEKGKYKDAYKHYVNAVNCKPNNELILTTVKRFFGKYEKYIV